jgi:hypothetical protein
MISSTNYVACISVILRNFKDDYGGIYIFIILIRILFGNNNLISMPYSLLCVVSIYRGLRTYIANPPLEHSTRLDSISENPSKVGGAAPSAIHVSWRHSTSMSSYSNIRCNFR